MSKITVYNQKGESIKEINLPDEIFGLEINQDLLHQAYMIQKNTSRNVIAETRKRADVRGGGRKPWKQKHTGRARAGSIRSPLFKGGGSVFGPTSERNFVQKINKKARRKAILMALSSKVVSESLFLLDKIEVKEVKTKEAAAILKAMPFKGRTLIVQPEKDELVAKSFRNIPKVCTIGANSINVVDLLENKNLMLTEKGIDKIKEIFG
ncbi:MAG: 50S ribosomal protein L4 [bacterium]